MSRKSKIHQKTNKRYVNFTYTIAHEDALDGLIAKNDGKEYTFYNQKTGEKVSACKCVVSCMERNSSSKPEKVVTKLYDAGKYNINPNYEIRKYDYLVGVDTNTKEINGKFVSIGVLTISGPIIMHKDNSVSITYPPTSIYVFRNISDKRVSDIEQMDWICAIIQLQRWDEYKSKKIGIIVDSSLNKLDGYNSRKEKILNSFILPNNCEFIYASADVNDTLYNKIIAFTDKWASDLLNETACGKDVLNKCGEVKFAVAEKEIMIEFGGLSFQPHK